MPEWIDEGMDHTSPFDRLEQGVVDLVRRMSEGELDEQALRDGIRLLVSRYNHERPAHGAGSISGTALG